MITTQDLLTVQQAAHKTGLSEHTLRYYERIGVLQAVGRAANGHRRYAPEDLRLLQFLVRLRATGMSLEMMKQYADLIRAGEGNEAERLALLRAHREKVLEQIAALNESLAVIEWKIESYSEVAACSKED